MASDRWRQVEDLFHAALARRGEERRAFLADACQGDAALLREVESLLAQESGAEGFLSVPAAALAGSAGLGRTLVGARFGSYTIRALLGAGGMGEVYRAHDETLGREVAIKVLSSAFTADAERRTRFEREARMLATLNHPHIGAIYGVEDSDGVRGLVLELVEGETLAERLASVNRAPGAHAPGLSDSEALAIARQIAEALEAAHEKGIVHRDLKPANIKITPNGVVKVLDFGLAKFDVREGLGRDLSKTPAISTGATHDGAIFGTVAYMSPEQARGKPLDKRTDIWSFGCVLYEMLTGRSPFAGETVSDKIAAILEREPDWQVLPDSTLPDVRRMLQRCLEKDPKRRLHDVADVRIEIEDAITTFASGRPTSSVAAGAQSPSPARQSLWRRLVAPTAAAIVAGIAVGSTVWLATRPNAPPVTRLEIAPTGGAALSLSNRGGDLAVTRDGSLIYRGAGTTGAQLLIRARDQLPPRPIAGLHEARDLFLSPDGQSIGFASETFPIMLSKVAITGGKAIPICRVGPASRGATWGDDDTIIFASIEEGKGLQRVSSHGGEPAILTTPNSQRGEGHHFWPQYLPGSRAVLFTITSRTGGIETSKVAVLDLVDTQGEPKVLVAGSQAHYLPSGHLVYAAAGGALHAIRFDLQHLTIVGDPMPLPIEVAVQSTGAAEFDVGLDGTLAYVSASAVTTPARSLVWVDRNGHEEPIEAKARAYTYPRLSPDGTRVALDIRDEENDIWVWDFAGKNLTRVTRDPGFDRAPVWANDRDVIYSSQEGGGAGYLFRKPADGTGTAVPLTQSPNVQFPTSVTPDGKRVLFWDTVRGVFTVTLDKAHVEQPLVVLLPPFQARNAEVSPDGWLAYESNESGPTEISVRRLADVNAWKRQVSTAGGRQPVWARNGRELFYRAPGGALMSVTVGPGPTWAPGTPVKVIDGTGKYFAGLTTTPERSYDVSLDSKRFLMIKQDTSAPLGAVMVLNWVEELKRLLPR